MSVSIQKMTTVLRAMAQLFAPPTDFGRAEDAEALAKLWVYVLGDDFDDESISPAAMTLSRTLRAFPVPADFLALSGKAA
jgi:hypothetical protein